MDIHTLWNNFHCLESLLCPEFPSESPCAHFFQAFQTWFVWLAGDQFSGVSDLLEELGGAEDDQPDDGDGNLGGDDDDGYGLQLLEGEGEGQGEGSDEGTGSVVDAVQERGLEDVSSRLAALAIGAEVPSSCKQQGNTALERAAPVSRKEGQQGST